MTTRFEKVEVAPIDFNRNSFEIAVNRTNKFISNYEPRIIIAAIPISQFQPYIPKQKKTVKLPSYH